MELGSNRRETGWSLSVAGDKKLRAVDPSKGTSWTNSEICDKSNFVLMTRREERGVLAEYVSDEQQSQ